jgi:hypothetical protein
MDPEVVEAFAALGEQQKPQIVLGADHADQSLHSLSQAVADSQLQAVREGQR